MGSKVIARSNVKPFRKDVLTKNSKSVGGGDVTRKMKVMEKQKRGKGRVKGGKVRLTKEAFYVVIKK